VGPGLTIVAPAHAAARVHAALAALDGRDVALDVSALDDVLALLAGGRFERVRTLLRESRAADAMPLVLARYVAWTGDLRTAAGLWDAARASMNTLLAGSDVALQRASCTALAATATDVGDPQYAATLHGTLRRLAEADVAHQPHDVLDFVHDTLGAEPDATRHRLRLRPRTRQSLDVRQLRFGDGSVALRVDVTRHGVRCTVEQESGAIPQTVLLEPIVQGTVTAARVDGAPAELVPRPHDGLTIVPVQLVLDEVRVLEVATSP